MPTNYTLRVYKIDKDDTDAEDTLIIEIDGALTPKAKREIRGQIDDGRIQLREKKRTLA